MRGRHAFKEQQELIVALSGSFDDMVDDGKTKQTVSAQPLLLWVVCACSNLEEENFRGIYVLKN